MRDLDVTKGEFDIVLLQRATLFTMNLGCATI